MRCHFEDFDQVKGAENKHIKYYKLKMYVKELHKPCTDTSYHPLLTLRQIIIQKRDWYQCRLSKHQVNKDIFKFI